MKRRAFIAAATLTAALVLPLQASAHHKPGHTHGPPPWAGTPGGPNGVVTADPPADAGIVPPAGGTSTAGAEDGVAPLADKPAKPANSKRCGKAQKVGFAVIGTFGSYAEPELAVDVTEANKHARGWIAENGSSFDVTGAGATFEGIEDADASRTVGFEDALAGDAVELGGKLLRPKRGCEGETTLRVDRVSVTRPAPEEPVDPLVP
jgi:hypothetical protein